MPGLLVVCSWMRRCLERGFRSRKMTIIINPDEEMDRFAGFAIFFGEEWGLMQGGLSMGGFLTKDGRTDIFNYVYTKVCTHE